MQLYLKLYGTYSFSDFVEKETEEECLKEFIRVFNREMVSGADTLEEEIENMVEASDKGYGNNAGLRYYIESIKCIYVGGDGKMYMKDLFKETMEILDEMDAKAKIILKNKEKEFKMNRYLKLKEELGE